MNLVLQAAISDEISNWYDQIGPWLFYAVVWGLVFAGTGLFIGAFVPFITGDSLVFAAGLVAAGSAGSSSEVNIWVMAIGVGIAAWLGDQVGYTLGRHYGRPYLDRRNGAWLKSAIAKSEKFYQAWGWWAVVIARFMPWARVFIPPIAGIAKMNYYQFFTANFVGAVLWGTGLTVAGYFTYSIEWVRSFVYIIALVVIGLSIIAGVRTWRLNRNS